MNVRRCTGSSWSYAAERLQLLCAVSHLSACVGHQPPAQVLGSSSRCQMGGVPQSGDSAYGFCDETASSNPQASYEERTYPSDFRQNFQGNFTPAQMINQAQGFVPVQGSFPPNQGGFTPGQGNFAPSQGSFAPGQGNFGQYQEGHHLHHQDPATATLLHHHHIEVHRNSVHDHIDDHPLSHDHSHSHQHTCRNSNLHHLPPTERIERDPRVIQSVSGISPDISRMNQDQDGRMNQDGRMIQDGRMNQDGRLNQDGRMIQDGHGRMIQDGRMNQELRMNPELKDAGRMNQEISRMNPEMSRMNPEMSCINPEMSRMNPELIRLNPDRLKMAHMSQMYPEDMEMTHIQDGRFNTLRGHLNHPESTSDSDTGSFTLTRQQRPQPQGSKRRPNKHKPEKPRQNITSSQEKLRQNVNSSLRLTELQIEQLNLRMNERNDKRMNERIDSRDRLNDSIRERGLNDSIREPRDRLSDSRNELDRMNEPRISDRMNEARLSERMNERVCDRINESRLERMNDSRISERLNDSRLDRLNDSRVERINDPRIERMNDSRISDRMNDSRFNDSRINRIIDSCDRMNESRHERTNESRISDRIERMTDLNSSIRIEGSPKIRTHISPLRVPLPRTSPKNLPKEHPRQSSSDSNKTDFFVPPPPIISPLSPNTEESLLSDDDRPQDTVYSNDPDGSKCLGPDAKYEPVTDEKGEILKSNHRHCYSDTNTMDSGWQSGSERQVTD
ncbi:putative translation initiation factor IF-2, partial [Operophtera brumata]